MQNVTVAFNERNSQRNSVSYETGEMLLVVIKRKVCLKQAACLSIVKRGSDSQNVRNLCCLNQKNLLRDDFNPYAPYSFAI